jgi:hypothetical protein
MSDQNRPGAGGPKDCLHGDAISVAVKLVFVMGGGGPGPRGLGLAVAGLYLASHLDENQVRFNGIVK